ncbi:MAG: hypothetical protein ABIX01_14580 [Chitinophagaceae bacterium]
MIEENLNASVIMHVIKLSETWKKNGDFITMKYGITTQQWFIMLLLANDPNNVYLRERNSKKELMAMELAEALNVSRANITNLLNVLLRKKLILQAEDNIDKRCKRLRLSATGKKLLKSLESLRAEYNGRLFSIFTDTEKQGIIDFTVKCLGAMQLTKSVK